MRHSPSKAVKPARQSVDVIQYLGSLEPAFNAALTEQGILWAKEFEYAKQALDKNSTLKEAAASHLDSFRAAIINVAAAGITLNPIKKQAYLVPRGGRVCLDISYQGLIDLAVDAGSILWAEAKLVYAGDNYKNLGVAQPPLHEFEPFGDRGAIIGAYSLAKRHDGTYHILEMSRAELDHIKKKAGAQSAGSPWVEWFDQMCLKAVIKRAAKWWANAGDRFHTAVDLLNQQEGNADIIEHDWPPTDSETLNLLLDHDDSPVVEGQTVETWILAAETGEDFARTREMLRELPESATKNRLKALWLKLRDDMAALHARRQAEEEEAGA